jgi:hypothetical protein
MGPGCYCCCCCCCCCCDGTTAPVPPPQSDHDAQPLLQTQFSSKGQRTAALGETRRYPLRHCCCLGFRLGTPHYHCRCLYCRGHSRTLPSSLHPGWVKSSTHRSRHPHRPPHAETWAVRGWAETRMRCACAPHPRYRCRCFRCRCCFCPLKRGTTNQEGATRVDEQPRLEIAVGEPDVGLADTAGSAADTAAGAAAGAADGLLYPAAAAGLLGVRCCCALADHQTAESRGETALLQGATGLQPLLEKHPSWGKGSRPGTTTAMKAMAAMGASALGASRAYVVGVGFLVSAGTVGRRAMAMTMWSAAVGHHHWRRQLLRPR